MTSLIVTIQSDFNNLTMHCNGAILLQIRTKTSNICSGEWTETVRAMARLLLLLVPLLVMVSSTDSRRGDMQGEQDDYYNFDEIDNQVCGGAFDNGLNPECQPPPPCNVTWCRENCDILCVGDQPCQDHPLCEEKGCPCPLYTKKDLNISVSCNTSQSVMDFDFSEVFNLNLDKKELTVSLSMQVV